MSKGEAVALTDKDHMNEITQNEGAFVFPLGKDFTLFKVKVYIAEAILERNMSFAKFEFGEERGYLTINEAVGILTANILYLRDHISSLEDEIKRTQTLIDYPR